MTFKFIVTNRLVLISTLVSVALSSRLSSTPDLPASPSTPSSLPTNMLDTPIKPSSSPPVELLNDKIDYLKANAGCFQSEQFDCLIRKGCTDKKSCCSILEKKEAESCFTCGDFNPAECTILKKTDTICDAKESLIHNTKIISCHCSECLAYSIGDALSSSKALEQSSAIAKNIEGAIAKTLTEKLSGSDPQCNGLVCKDIPINIDPVVVDAINSIGIKARIDCNNPPKLTGMENLISIGRDSTICPAGNVDPQLCAKLGPDARITPAFLNGLFTSEKNKVCAFKSLTREYNASLVLPILFEIDVSGKSNYAVGILLEVEIPFVVAIEMNFTLPSCSDVIGTGDLSAVASLAMKLGKNSKPVRLLPMRSQITGDASAFKKKLFFSAMYSFEKDIRQKIELDKNLAQCGEDFFKEIPPMQCSAQFGKSISFTCQPPALPSFSKCKAAMQTRLSDYSSDIVTHIKDMLRTMLNEADIPHALNPI